MDFGDRQARYRGSIPAVLDFAWDADAFRADHVMAALNLTRSTALSALDSLIGLGLIRELPKGGAEEDYRLGRPARRFELRGDAGLVVGVDAGGRHFSAAVADLTGRVLAREALPLPPEADTENRDIAQRRAAALRVVDAVLEVAKGSRQEVIAVGVGVPAPVDGHGRSPSNPSGFWRAMNADLQESLGKVFPVVRVENDAALAAVAEGSLGETRGCDHFVAMLAGRRLGSGVFLEGRLMRGAHGAVGELEALSYVAGVGGTLGLGHLAETWLKRRLASGRIPAAHPWARLTEAKVTAEAVLADARWADPVARPLLEELGGTLGRVCSVVSRFYDPEVIVVCGAMAGALGEVIEVARAHLAREVELPPPAIVPSTLGGDVVSLGAVSAAREAARDVVLPLLAGRRSASGIGEARPEGIE